MYCQGESSNTTHNSPESSQYFNGGFGFVSSSNTNSQARGSRPTGGFVSHANLPQFQGNGTFQHQRNYQNHGANNGRFNNRPRFNNGSSGRFSGNSNYFSGSSSNNGGSNFGPKGGSTWQNWNGNNGSKSALIPECQICNKRGHTAPNCYSRYDTSSSTVSQVPECQICGKKGHTALNCYHRGNYAYQGTPPPPSISALTAQAQSNFAGSSQQNWVLDTGATHHMTADLDNLTLWLILKEMRGLQWAMEKGFMLSTLDKATKKVLLRGRSSSSGLYYIPQQQFFKYSQLLNTTPQTLLGQLVKSSIWHHRLGHPTNEVQ